MAPSSPKVAVAVSRETNIALILVCHDVRGALRNSGYRNPSNETVTVASQTVLTANGTGDTYILGTQSSVTLSGGTTDTVNVNGTGVTITDSDPSDTINVAAYGSATLNVNNATIALSQDAIAALDCTGNNVSLSTGPQR